jgi:hypothetical protein
LKAQLLAILIFFILAFAYLHADYEGGFSPRYVRHSEIIIIILTIFLTSYISKLNNKIILLIFILFVSISVTNSISLAIRTDWNYGKITDLVSYDIVLWPWIPSKSEDITLDLRKVSEQSKWNLEWEEGCNPPITEPRLSVFGLELGPCECSYNNNASRIIRFPREFKYLKIEACSLFAGGDGALLEIFIDNESYSYFINSQRCESIILNISGFADDNYHLITLSAKRNGVCDYEVISVKKLAFLKHTEILREENLIKNPLIWRVYSPCGIYWLNDSIVTDKCYCTFSSYAYTILNFRKEAQFMNIEVCADEAGGDGVLAKIIVNNKTYAFLVPSFNCTTRSILLDLNDREEVNITLTSDTYEYCRNERVFWKSIRFESIPTGIIEKPKEIHNLEDKKEQENWKSINSICPAMFSIGGIKTDVCGCYYPSGILHSFSIQNDKEIKLTVKGCADFAGGDGVIGEISVDGNVTEMFINSNSCNYLEKKIKLSKGNHTLYLQPKIYGSCSAEWIIWKEVMIEE